MESIRGLRPLLPPSSQAVRPAATPGQAVAPAPEAPAADSVALLAPAPPAAEEGPVETGAAAPVAPPRREAPPAEIGGFLLADETPATPEAEVAFVAPSATLAPEPGPEASSSEVASWCYQVAKSSRPLAERTALIAPVLSKAVERAESPNSGWTKATPRQVALFVQETLEHTDALQRVGRLRGQDWSHHDFEGPTSKFNPEITQFLALPGRDESVKWAIARHNGSDHHAVWANPQARTEDLAESASDIVNAWRMNRRVYEKPSWSWERITGFIETQFQYNELSAPQRDALLAAIPHQMEEERRNGLPS